MAGFINRFRGSGKPAARVDQHGSAPYGPAPMLTGALIGAGGEGAVYDDREDPAMVIKVLHPQHATAERASKLQAMCDNPPPNWQALGWPNAVEANSNGLRYRMPKVPKDAGQRTGSLAPMSDGSCRSSAKATSTGLASV